MHTQEEKKHYPGILDRALSIDRRRDFIKYREGRKREDYDELSEMAAYILSKECESDIKRLINGDFFFSIPHHFRIPKNFSGRKRDIYVWNGTERYLLSLFTYIMRDHDDIYSPGLYSFRINLTARDFLLKLRNNPDTPKYYIVKSDVSNYVSSIVPELIIPQLEEVWKDDPQFLNLLKFFLLRRECIERDGSVVSCEPGGLGGNPFSNHFMNIYLTELDEYFYDRAAIYCRYSDDIIIFARDKAEADEFLSFFYEVLKKKKLHTNIQKTEVIEPGGEVDILGCRLKDGEMDISDHAKAKLKRKMRMRSRFLNRRKTTHGITDREAAESMALYCNKMFFGGDNTKFLSWSRWLFPVITNTGSLNELDLYAQNAIRYAYCGSFAKKRYRLTYDDIKNMGYKNLVHSYYHFTFKDE